MTNAEGNPSSTGEVQAEVILKTVEQWELEASVVAFVFDTTGSNSGVDKGACVRVQKKMGRKILFLACRHHLHELLAKNTWYKIFPKDDSPHCKLFMDLKREWEDLDTSSEAEIQILDLPISEREALIVFFQEIYTNGDKVLLRHDYKELVEICLKLLGAELPAEKVFSWKKVGAVHKARFMAWSLCSLKAFAFSSNMDFSEETKENLRRITLFQITIYIPHFLMSSIGSDAAFNDLSLHKKLQKFQDIDEVIGGEALKTLERHLWYLSDLTIPMALFSEKVDPDIKARLAARILAMKNNKKKAQKLGKPKFPKIGRTTELYDLVTEDSWEFFSIIKVDDNWLEQPVGSWEDSEDYRTARNFVHNVKTTNDLAERAIKTATDYSQILTKDEETRRRIIQGVEDHRRTYPDFRKSILNK